MGLSRLRHRAALAGFTAGVCLAALITTNGIAHAVTDPSNDSIANATPIQMSVLPGQNETDHLPQVSIADATADDNAADGALTTSDGAAEHTVWYKFDPGPGQVSITISSSSIASVVAGVVTTTTSDADINGVNDTFNAVQTSSVINTDSSESGSALAHTTSLNQSATFSFTADAAVLSATGRDYYLAVGSVGSTSVTDDSSLAVQVSYTAAPLNDDFADATVITPSVKAYSDDTTGATPDLAPDGTNLDPVVDGQPGMFSVWYSFTAPRNGRVALSTAGSSFPVVFEVCQSLGGSPSPDACGDNDLRDSGAGAAPATHATFQVLDRETYYVFLDGQQVSGQTYNAFGPYQLGFTFSPSAIDDDISTPTVLNPAGVDRVSGSNVGAQAVVLGSNPPTTITQESDAGLVFDGGGQQHSVWYRYRPHKTARMVLYTTGSLNTDVEVFRGSVAAGFTNTGFGNDNYSAHQTFSRFVLPVTAGSIYYIGVDGSTTANYPEGSFGLDLGALPANDNVKGAAFLAKHRAKIGKKHKTVSRKSGTVKGSTDFATFQSGEKSPRHFTGNADVWYTFVAPKAGHYTFSESLRHAGALLAAYSGKGKSNLGLKLVAAATHSVSKPASIKIKAKAGQKFKISVDGSAHAFGNFTLTWK
ncbi:MAG TPA: hypothetical protein VHV79_06990 [Mycobacteriales bacterium]|nr:hypothetical protein [Mycobacteriales bacterium]